MENGKNTNFKSGFVTIIGRPNVGKSTLLNALIKNKVSIVSKIPQTTRHQIRGILNLENAQIVFVDSPGMHMFKESLAQHLNTVAKKAMSDIELILYVVDVSRAPGREEEKIMKVLLQQRTKIIMVLNKIDRGKKYLNDYVELWKHKCGGEKVFEDLIIFYIPVSAKLEKNIDQLQQAVVENLPAGVALYETDQVTDFPIKYRVADIVREKLFHKLEEELPHSIAVEVTDIEDKKKIKLITVNVYVNRNSQKRIIIGKKGEFIKDIGVNARKELEQIFNKKVYLEIWVKIIPNWQEKIRILQELGYHVE